MAKHGKKYDAAASLVEREREYELDEAVGVLKQFKTGSFDETAELAVRLGVNPSKSDQMVRGTVALPHGTGRDVRVVVFATGPAADAAREAGAMEVGFEDLITKVQQGWVDFDVAVATPEAMKEVRKLGKVLGPRSLMPNPKTGTVTDDTGAAVEQCKAGRVEFKMDRHGNVMMPFGKLSFDKEKLIENCRTALGAVKSARPETVKGQYIKRATVSSTMGPGIQLSSKEITA